MATQLGSVSMYRTYDGTHDTVRLRVQVNIGATGAPTVVGRSDLIAVTRSGTGTYTATFPQMAAQATSLGSFHPRVVLSAAKTVGTCIVTALDLGAGTASFTTALTGGTAADPASGDILEIVIVGNFTGVP